MFVIQVGLKRFNSDTHCQGVVRSTLQHPSERGHIRKVAANGKSIGRIDGAPLADAMLAAFLGPKPGSPALKQALLDRHG